MQTMPAWDRATALEDLRPLLSRFLRESASQYPVDGYVDEIFQLPPGELDLLVATHVLLDSRTARMLQAATELTRSLPSSVSRTDEELQATVRGPVDWARTVQRRYVTGDRTAFVCRPTERRYDSALAHLIANSLRECDRLAAATPFDLTRGEHEGIGEEVRHRVREARQLSRHPKIAHLAHRRARDVPEATVEAVIRRRPVARDLAAFLELVSRVNHQRDPAAIADVIRRRVLAPGAADKIFELQVAMSIIDRLRVHGFNQIGPPRILRRQVPLYVGSHADGRRVEVWWQKETWSVFREPNSAIRGATLRDARMTRGPYRPDLIVTVDPSPRRLLVEAKVTEGAGTADERTGITEMLAYLYDASSVTSNIAPPHGLVAAWNATGKPAHSIVMVSDQDNIGVAVDLFLSPLDTASQGQNSFRELV